MVHLSAEQPLDRIDRGLRLRLVGMDISLQRERDRGMAHQVRDDLRARPRIDQHRRGGVATSWVASSGRWSEDRHLMNGRNFPSYRLRHAIRVWRARRYQRRNPLYYPPEDPSRLDPQDDVVQVPPSEDLERKRR